MNVKEMLVHMVRAGRQAMELDEAMKKLGYEDNPYFGLFGEIAESIYWLTGEKAEAIDETKAWTALTDQSKSPDQCVNDLLAICHQNSSSPVRLSPAALSTLSDIAEERNTDMHELILMVINEWTLRQRLFRNLKVG